MNAARPPGPAGAHRALRAAGRHLPGTVLFAAALGAALPSSAGEISAWVIDGRPERAYFRQLEAAFNAAQDEVSVRLVPLPGYNDTLRAAAISLDFPDVIMVDGPNLASMAWPGLLRTLDDLLDPAIAGDLLPAVRQQGLYGPGHSLYAVSPYESTAVIWGNREILDAAGIAVPATMDAAWTVDDLEELLAVLQRQGGIEWPLDLGLDAGASEWMSFGIAPFVQSAGGDIVDRDTWQAEGTLNSQVNVAVLERLQGWVEAGYVVPASAGGNTFFGSRTSALAWAGDWMWQAHLEGLGDNLVMIPAPSFGGSGPVAPNGGWGWAVPSTTENLEDVSAFLNFALSVDQVVRYADMTGYMPSRVSALRLMDRYRPGGAGALMAEQAACCARPRPVHPAYPVIAAAWSRAVTAILAGGADVQTQLDRAARAIDEDIRDNDGYPQAGR